ncbi:MAG: hypothetical protein U0807_11505 [Candidatus Binatia bacterium]
MAGVVGIPVLAVGFLAAAATLPGGTEVRYDERRGTIRSMSGANLAADLERAPAYRALQVPGREVDLALAFVDGLRQRFGLVRPADELRSTAVDTDGLGFRHVRLQQVYRGRRIHGAELIVHLDRDRHVTGVTGGYVRTPTGVATTPALGPAEAVQRATAAVGARVPQAATPTLAYHADGDGTTRLAYAVRVTRSLVDATEVWIDAQTGGVLARVPTAYPIAPTPGGLGPP